METVYKRTSSTSSKPWSTTSSSSSFTTVSKAFSSPTLKRSPRVSAVQGLVEASTANGFDNFILQPKKISGNSHDKSTLFENGESETVDSSKVIISSHGRSEGFAADRPHQSQESLQQIARASQTRAKNTDLARILNDPYAKGNHAKAAEVIDLLDNSEQGIIEAVRPSQSLLGAVNREGVTCYLDSLLFSMFATLDSYEAMIRQDFADEPRRRLALLLRLWVNLFRSGRLITTDIVLFSCNYVLHHTDCHNRLGRYSWLWQRAAGKKPPNHINRTRQKLIHSSPRN